MIAELRPFLRFLRLVRVLDRINRYKSRSEDKEFYSKDHVEAARSLATQRYKEVTKAYDYRGVHPDIVVFWRAFDKHCKKRNIPLWAFEFVRSKKRQATLYKKGRSKAKAGESPHQYGMAVDVVHATRAWNLTKKEWDVLGSIGKEIARKKNLKMEWGGDWKFYDPAHWQIKDWRDQLDRQ